MPSATVTAALFVDVECPICGSTAQVISYGIVAPFLTELFNLPVGYTSRYCQCDSCNLVFFDLRYEDDQMSLLYSNYRSDDYLDLRRQWEPWYSRKVNDAYSTQTESVDVLERAGIPEHLHIAVDFGGDQGQFFPDVPIDHRLVCDVSDRSLPAGVEHISSLGELGDEKADLVIIAQVLEHLPNPVSPLKDIRNAMADDGRLYVEVPLDRFGVRRSQTSYRYQRYLQRLVRHRLSFIALDFASGVSRQFLSTIPWFGVVKQSEHINYFSEQSLHSLLQRTGFTIVAEHADRSAKVGGLRVGRYGVVAKLNPSSRESGFQPGMASLPSAPSDVARHVHEDIHTGSRQPAATKGTASRRKGPLAGRRASIEARRTNAGFKNRPTWRIKLSDRARDSVGATIHGVRKLVNPNLRGHPEHATLISNATYSPWLVDSEFRSVLARVAGQTLMDEMRLYEIWQLAGQVGYLSGDAIEIGCWQGGTGCMMSIRIAQMAPTATVFLCDTFSGVVKAGPRDLIYRGGEHADASQHLVEGLANQLGLQQVQVLAGMFPEETGKLLDGRMFKFAHIDVDVYRSAKDSFEWLLPRLVDGAIVVFDDYGFASTDGIRNFIDELQGRPEVAIMRNLNGQATLVKRATPSGTSAAPSASQS
jgi:O-methyltransferase